MSPKPVAQKLSAVCRVPDLLIANTQIEMQTAHCKLPAAN